MIEYNVKILYLVQQQQLRDSKNKLQFENFSREPVNTYGLTIIEDLLIDLNRKNKSAF